MTNVQNMASKRPFEPSSEYEKLRQSVVFDDNAFDEVTFQRTGDSIKTLDEVS